MFTPVVGTVALQLMAYYCAQAKGCPIDRPRNLAKSVTSTSRRRLNGSGSFANRPSHLSGNLTPRSTSLSRAPRSRTLHSRRRFPQRPPSFLRKRDPHERVTPRQIRLSQGHTKARRSPPPPSSFPRKREPRAGARCGAARSRVIPSNPHRRTGESRYPEVQGLSKPFVLRALSKGASPRPSFPLSPQPTRPRRQVSPPLCSHPAPLLPYPSGTLPQPHT